MKLAEAASHAVDFPKTGAPAAVPKTNFQPGRLQPDFLAKEWIDLNTKQGRASYYPSEKALGHLFRNVPMAEYEPATSNNSPTAWGTMDSALRLLDLPSFGLPPPDTPSENLLQEMRYILHEYSYQLLDIAETHALSKSIDDRLSEAELVSGTIQARWVDHRKRWEAVTAMNLQVRVTLSYWQHILTTRLDP